MRPQKILTIITAIFLFFNLSSATADDAKIIKKETRTVIGTILIDYDLASSGRSVYIVESKTGQQIWINTLHSLPPKFKTFAISASENGKIVRMTGTIETWSDGNMVLNDQRSYTYQFIR